MTVDNKYVSKRLWSELELQSKVPAQDAFDSR